MIKLPDKGTPQQINAVLAILTGTVYQEAGAKIEIIGTPTQEIPGEIRYKFRDRERIFDSSISKNGKDWYISYQPISGVVDFSEEPLTEVESEALERLYHTFNFRAVIDRVIRWQDLEIGVEYLPGQVRFAGTAHSKKLRCGYGHLRGYRGNDREALDCYVHPDLLDADDAIAPPNEAFLIEQVSPEDGDFDEYKVMVGWDAIADAKAAYLTEMPAEYFGSIRTVTRQGLEQFKRQ